MSADEVPHLRARGASVSGLARSAIVTLPINETKVSVEQDKQVIKQTIYSSGELTSSPDLPTAPGGPRGPTVPFRKDQQKTF